MMNYAKIKKYDIANGTGIGSALFVSGCTHKCKGCFNEEAWNFNYGKPYTKEVEDIYISYLQDSHVTHASLLGGEIMQQDSKIILNLVKRIKEETNVDIWCWTGCLFEELIDKEDKFEILKYIDVLIDGKFEIKNKDLSLKYKGSTNQRVIDVQKSLKENRIILY